MIDYSQPESVCPNCQATRYYGVCWDCNGTRGLKHLVDPEPEPKYEPTQKPLIDGKCPDCGYEDFDCSCDVERCARCGRRTDGCGGCYHCCGDPDCEICS